MTSKYWYLLNESSSIDVPGDITLFKTEHEAISYMEPIDVESEEYYVLRSDGLVLMPKTDGKSIWLEISEAYPNGLDIVQRLIQHLCNAVQETHPARSPG